MTTNIGECQRENKEYYKRMLCTVNGWQWNGQFKFEKKIHGSVKFFKIQCKYVGNKLKKISFIFELKKFF